MPGVSVYLRVYVIRFLQNIGRYCDHYLSLPLPNSYSFTRRIRNTTYYTGNFDLYFYTSSSSKSRSEDIEPSSSTPLTVKKCPLLVNFHGGGYTIGHATDDSRFFTSILETSPKAVICSLNYRLAPTDPFPTGIEDCVSAILYLWSHAEELNLDPSRIILSGFSAGGNFCFGVSYRLHEEIQKRRDRGELSEEIEKGKIIGIAAIYPAVDWTLERDERNTSNPNYKPLTSLLGFDIFEKAYLTPQVKEKERGGMLLSPGLASDEILKERLPDDICIVTCWGDGLLVEGEKFRERLKGVGKRVEGRMVDGAVHGWDKWPSWWWGDRVRDKIYGEVGEWVREIVRP